MKHTSKAAIIENRLVKHNYFIQDTLVCGIELQGREVKSIRYGMASIKEAWIKIENNELILKSFYITKWDTANLFDINPKRDRRLLAHKKEIRKLYNKVKTEGYTLIPLKVYFNDENRCKVLIGVCKGKHLYDKRDSEKSDNMKREASRIIKEMNK